MNDFKKTGDLVLFYTKGITPTYVFHSNTLVLNQKCVRGNRIDFSLAQYTDDSSNISEDKLVKVGDIIINSTGQGTAGRVAFVNKKPNDIRVVLDSHMLLLRCGSYEASRCLNYSLYSFEETLQSFLDGSTGQGELDKVRLFNIKTAFPSDPTAQKNIVAVLQSLDNKIELNNLINSELEVMAKTIYDYWFVQFDFPNENNKPYKSSGGKMIYNEVLKRDIPKDWSVKTLSKITSIATESVNPGNFPDKLFKHLSIPSFDAAGSFFEEKGETIGSNKFKVSSTDILVSKLNPKFSRVVYVTKEDDLICSTEFVVWRPENQKLKSFLYSIAKDPSFISFCQQSASGTSNSHKRINPTVMMDYKIAYNESVAELFGKYIEATIKKMMVNNLETKQLVSLRDWLLPMLMNGQITVK